MEANSQFSWRVNHSVKKSRFRLNKYKKFISDQISDFLCKKYNNKMKASNNMRRVFVFPH